MSEQSVDGKNSAASIISVVLALSQGYAILRHHIVGPIGVAGGHVGAINSLKRFP